MTVDRISDAAGFEGLRDDWDRLALRAGNRSVFLTWEWLYAWWRHVGAADALHLIRVRDSAGSLLGIGPFCIRTEGGLVRSRVLTFLGTTRVSSEYLDIIADPDREEEVAGAICGELLGDRSSWDFARLTDLLEPSLLGRGLALVPARSAPVVYWEQCQECPYLPLPASIERFWSERSRRLGSAYSRSLRKLSERGVEWRVVDRAPDLGPALETLFALHAKRWAREGRPGNFRDDCVRNFHHEVAGFLAERDRIRIFELRLADRPIASLYALEYRGRLTYYQSGFDPEPPDAGIKWSDYSPGLLTVGHCIEEGIHRRADEFDFLRGMEPYKLRWTSRSRATRTLTVVAPRRWRARGQVYIHQTVGRARRVAGRAARAALGVASRIGTPERKG